MQIHTLDKSDIVKIARHIGAFRGDDARTKKSAFVEILTGQPTNVIESAIDDLGISVPAIDWSTDHATDNAVPKNSSDDTVKTVETVKVSSGNAASDLERAIREIAGGAVDENRVNQIVQNSMSGFLETVQDMMNNVNHVTRVEIQTPDGTVRQIEGIHHKAFPDLLLAASTTLPDGARFNFWLVGPAGTGKTTAAENLAEALDLPFGSIGTQDNPYGLSGFIDANGNCIHTLFRKIFESGGVFLIDEIDGWFPNAALWVNSATANGFAQFPDGMVKRHPDCIIICAANTYGNGGNQDYVGRMKQDAAFLDRFVFIDWPIDENLERALCADDEWCSTVQTYRAKAVALGLKVLITPRATIFGPPLLAAGIDRNKVINMVIRKGMTDEQWSQVSV